MALDVMLYGVIIKGVIKGGVVFCGVGPGDGFTLCNDSLFRSGQYDIAIVAVHDRHNFIIVVDGYEGVFVFDCFNIRRASVELSSAVCDAIGNL